MAGFVEHSKDVEYLINSHIFSALSFKFFALSFLGFLGLPIGTDFSFHFLPHDQINATTFVYWRMTQSKIITLVVGAVSIVYC